MGTEIAARLYDRLLARYGDPHWWPAGTPYEVMAGAVLTQNTAWANVEKALANFEGRLSPQYVLSLSERALAEIIRPAGFFSRKAGYLRAVTLWYGRYGFCDAAVRALPQPRVREELLAIRGVGPETADSMLLYAFGFPSFVADAYTARLARRLPLPAGQGYYALRDFFERNLPRDSGLYNRYHALIVVHAKAHCRKRPLCAGCPAGDICKREGEPPWTKPAGK